MAPHINITAWFFKSGRCLGQHSVHSHGDIQRGGQPGTVPQQQLRGQGHPGYSQMVYAVSLKDREILMAHSSSKTTKIYTHPNFELAAEFINRLPEAFKMSDPSATKRVITNEIRGYLSALDCTHPSAKNPLFTTGKRVSRE